MFYPPPLERSSNRLRAGFTLIEIAIVLVIIGLLVGGIMVGADLIKVARLRSAASDLEKVSAAVNTFKVKYNCTPGDCPNALNYFPSTYSTYGACSGNGDGNGLIDQWPCETNTALAGLVAAGFMPYKPGPNSGNPQTSSLYWRGYGYSNAYFYYTDLYGAIDRVGNSVTWSTYNANNTWASNAAMTPADALAIDEKIDDGYPSTGAFLGLDSSTVNNVWMTVGSCVAAGTNTYDASSRPNAGCRTMYFLQ